MESSKKEGSVKDRQKRYFSESFKKQKVRDLEKNLTTVSMISREYSVTRSAIYKWIYKYSPHRKRGVRMIVEPMSEAKKVEELRKRIKELEQMVGQKQIQVEFMQKMIELAEEDYQIEIKKKSGSKPSSGSGLTGKNTGSK